VRWYIGEYVLCSMFTDRGSVVTEECKLCPVCLLAYCALLEGK